MSILTFWRAFCNATESRVDQFHLLHVRPRAFESGGVRMACSVVVCLGAILLMSQFALFYRMLLLHQDTIFHCLVMLALIAATILVLERRFWRLLFGWRLPPSDGFYLLPFVKVWRSTILGDWLSPYVAEDDLLSNRKR